MKRKLLVLVLVLMTLGCAIVAECSVPTGSLEFVSCYAAGGGHDTMLRAMLKVLTDQKIIENPISIVYKPGGNSTVGMSYMSRKSGSNSHIMATTIGFITAPMQTNVGMSYEDFTPIARLAVETNVIVVRADSGIKTLQDLLDHKGQITWGGTGTATSEHKISLGVKKVTGLDIEYVPFEADGETVTALLGKHVDVIGTGYSKIAEFLRTGELVALAACGEQRKAVLPDLPTLREQGVDVAIVGFRGVYGPPKMAEDARQWFEDKLKQMVETPEWKTVYLEPSGCDTGWLDGVAFKETLDELAVSERQVMIDLGLIKK